MSNPKPSSPGRLNSLHDLVLDYVTHHAYASTARVLSHPRPKRSNEAIADSGPSETNGNGAVTAEENDDMDIDEPTSNGEGSGLHKDRVRERQITEAELASIERRRVILDYILNGAIMRAVEALQTHFPAVLDESSPQASSSVSQSTYADQSTWKAGPKPWSRPAHTGWNTADHSTPVLVQSSHPQHVKLNLQIQSFIESFRNLANSPSSSPASSISSLTSSAHFQPMSSGRGFNGTSHMPFGRVEEAIATGSSQSGRAGEGNGNGREGNGQNQGVTLTNALTAAQELHAEAKKLPADVRAVYLQEIKDVGALFAYTDPETSILKGFLEQRRRIALAEQVNAAILGTEDTRGPAFLRSIAERTSALYSIMNEKGIDPRPSPADFKSGKRDHLSGYWKHQAGGRYSFSLHEFVEQTWN